MKIVQIITELRPAGAERIVSELSKDLVSLGHRVFVVSLLPLPQNSNILVELKGANIPIFTLNLTKFKWWRIFLLKNILKKIQPDIVHSHLIHANITSRLNSLTKNYSLINSVHIEEQRQGKGWHFFLDAITYKYCDCMTAVSKSVQKFHSEKIEVSQEKIPVIYNGIKIPRLLTTYEIEKLRVCWGVNKCAKVIGSLGRLHQQKGYDLFLKTLPLLSKSIPQNQIWGVVILGEGEERKSLKKLIEFVPSNIIVQLPGFSPDAADQIAAFDLFVMPSRSEGFGLTLAEAMAHGVPIIINNIGVLLEIIQDYPNGLIADFTNKGEVINKISQGIKMNRTSPFIKFSKEEMTKNYLLLYEKINNMS